MEIKEFKKYSKCIDSWTGKEIDEFELLTDDELDEIQYDLENNYGDNLAPIDTSRAFLTFRYKIAKLEDALSNREG